MEKKVLQVLGGLGRGGIETFIMNVYRSIDRSQIQFDFLLRTKGGDYEAEARSLGAEIFIMGERNTGVIRYYHSLDVFFKERARFYDAIHVHASSLSNIEVLYFAKKHGIQTRILHSHSSSISGSKLHFITHLCFKPFVKYLATFYIGCSKKAIDWMFSGTGVYNKVVLLPNGIDVEEYRLNLQTRAFIRAELGLNDDNIIIGHVGRFVWIKNHKFIIDVFKHIITLNDKARLVLVGDGPLFQEIQSYISKSNLEGKVILLGQRRDISAVLQAFDVFLMPSFYEGLPVSLVEAQSSGLLIIGSDTISPDADLTGCIRFIPLSRNSQFWAEYTLKEADGYIRKDHIDELKSKGFDIKTTARCLTQIYNGQDYK